MSTIHIVPVQLFDKLSSLLQYTICVFPSYHIISVSEKGYLTSDNFWLHYSLQLRFTISLLQILSFILVTNLLNSWTACKIHDQTPAQMVAWLATVVTLLLWCRLQSWRCCRACHWRFQHQCDLLPAASDCPQRSWCWTHHWTERRDPVGMHRVPGIPSPIHHAHWHSPENTI